MSKLPFLGALTLALAASTASANEFEILESNAPSATGRFGQQVLMQGNLMIVASPAVDEVALYEKLGGSWSFTQTLIGNDTQPGDWFGGSIAIDGATIVVGARFHSHEVPVGNPLFNNGAAYVFRQVLGVWSQEAKLTTQDSEDLDWFGHSVSIDGDTVFVGVPFDDDIGPSSGSVFVYDRAGTTWTEGQKLTGSDSAPVDFFGWAVAVEGNVAVIGADLADAAGPESGAIYSFVRSGGSWAQGQKLLGSDTGPGDQFGSCVVMDGGTLLVGAVAADEGPAVDTGAAYVFTLSGSTLNQQAKLDSAPIGAGDQFGSSLAIQADRAVVGSPHNGISGFADGTGYVFARSGSTWSLDETLIGSDTQFDDSYGAAVALSIAAGNYAVGAPLRDDPNSLDVDTGGVYIHVVGGNPPGPVVYCTAKTSSGGCVTEIDSQHPILGPVSGANDYTINATSVQGLKSGLFFFGLQGTAAIPFNGGTLCMIPPVGRTPLQFSFGTDATSCDGTYSLIVNDGVSGFDPGSGNSAWFQTWYRDPQNGPGNFGTALSNAVELPYQ